MGLTWIGVAVGQRVAGVVHGHDVFGALLGPVARRKKINSGWSVFGGKMLAGGWPSGEWAPTRVRVRTGGDGVRYVIGYVEGQ